MARVSAKLLGKCRGIRAIGERRIPKRGAMGIHGLLSRQFEQTKRYYSTRRDKEAVDPNDTRLC